MPDNFSHQINQGKTVNIVGDHTIVQVLGEPKTFTDKIQPDIKRLFTSLRERYQNRYEQKLDGRFEITLQVSESFDSQNPQKFTERYTKDAKVSAAFPAINDAFEKKGRLLIVGNPGVGKTVLLLKLAVNLLNKTDLARQEAFPVIFNLAAWSSKEYKSFEDWLVTMLVSGYGLSKNFAARLLHQGRIIFLFDGLDELAQNRAEETAHQERAAFLASLNDYLQRGRKAVICCRREEFIQMRQRTNQDAPVTAKIEVLDLTKEDIRLALLFAQADQDSSASANNLLETIETNETFLEVLSTPFYFTTALEVFDKPLWTEKDFPSRIEEIKKYLLHRFVGRKLEHAPNPHNFQAEKTKEWLTWLAGRLNEHSSTIFELSDLHLADIRPEDIKKTSKRAWSYSNYMFLNLFIYFLFQLILGDTYGSFGYLIYFVVQFTFGNITLNGFTYEIPTEDILSLDLRKLIDWHFWVKLLGGVLKGASLGFITAVGFRVLIWGASSINRFFSGKTEFEPTESLILTGIIAGALTGFFITNFESLKKVKEFASLEHPYQRLLGGLSSRLFFSIVVILFFLGGMAGYEFQLRNGYLRPHYEIYMILVISPLFFVLFTFLSLPVIRHLILRLDLYRQGKMPLKYATFLDYAVSLRILEKDGGSWRFRHQNLQEHFVTSVPAPLVQDPEGKALQNPSQKPTGGQKFLAAFWIFWGQQPFLPFKTKLKRIIDQVFWESMGVACSASTIITLVFTFGGGEKLRELADVKLLMIAIYFIIQGIAGFLNVIRYLANPEEEIELLSLSPWNDDTPRGLRYRARCRRWTSVALLIEILCITGKYYWDPSLRW